MYTNNTTDRFHGRIDDWKQLSSYKQIVVSIQLQQPPSSNIIATITQTRLS